jgi:NAD(P)H-hydrate epimerase
MGTVDCDGMRELEEAAFRSGVTAEALMDKAGRRLGRALLRLYPQPGTAVAYVGKGNNGGDALVALRVMREAGWEVMVRCGADGSGMGELPRRKLRELGNPWILRKRFESLESARPLLLIDGLLGIGAGGALREPVAGLAAEMNALRREAGAVVAAVDVPSGLDGTTGVIADGAVVADLTLTIGVPKRGLLRDHAAAVAGRIELVPLEELPVPSGGDRLLVPGELREMLPERPFPMHKGDAGRVGIVAGSKGMLGAAVLTATGALRSGAGLVTLYVPEKLYRLMVAAGPPPELMVKPVGCYRDVLEEPLHALAVGPGLGGPKKEARKALFELLREFSGTIVLDADGLNLVAESGPEKHVREGMVLTPHPGEMARLFPAAETLDRAAAALAFVDAHPCTLLLKGARTVIASPGGPCRFNTTGTPGMASGGQGDVLTGVIAALAGAGATPAAAACCGAWLAGRASELAVTGTGGAEESLLASDTAGALGAAFAELRGRC